MNSTLIQTARTNRLVALEVLKKRDSNLVILGRERTRRAPELLFTSRRAASKNRSSVEMVA